ncbi:MAG: DUF3822 family protein [Bacteroidia bacterium]|nr:DUF3822 family protein [Bacteroidia bacterium]
MPIPHNFSDSEDNIKWLQHQFKIGSNFWVGTYNYPQLEASVIYAVPLLLYNSLLARFPSARYYSSGALLPEMYLNNYTEHQQTLVGLINHTHFYASVFIKGKLQLLNSYEINTDEDFMYFILNLMDKLQLSQNDCKVFLGGLIYDSDNKWQQLKKYIAHLNLMEINNKDISNGQVYFTNLFLHQCE